MKNIKNVIYGCIGLMLFCSCAKPPVPFSPIEPAALGATSELAIVLTQMAKKDVLTVVPYINVNPSKVNLQGIADYDNFFMQNIVIMDADYSADGTFSQHMLVESTDKGGRLDLRDELITFRLRDSNPVETTKIGDDLQKLLSKDRIMQLSKTDKAALEKGIKTYQQDNGLKVDGVYGKKTAQNMGESTSVIDILNITSGIVYPSEPRHATYIVPSTIVEKNPDEFYNGFESLETVKQNSIGPEKFPSMAKKGAQFTVFVYFFDRVDPYTPLSVRLSTSKLKATGSAGQKWFADPVKWPVLVETFTLNKDPKMLSGKLFVSVCIQDTESNRCISSSQIQ